MRAILDTNVLLSAIIRENGVASRIVDAWLARGYILVTHGRQLQELRTVTRRDRMRSFIRPSVAGRLINQLHANAEFIDRRLASIQRSNDPGDDFLLAMCEAGDADYLVTGDKVGLLALKSHGRTAIVTAREFLDRLARL